MLRRHKNDKAAGEESLFKADLLYNCMEEEVWVYYLPHPVAEDFEDFIRCLGRLKYPLGKGFSFIKLETENFLLIGNIGSKELKLTIKHTAVTNIKDGFEIQLNNYLRR
ncbi:MAG: hypothetical protein HZB81_00725 [Deltaproteobacteria bacterium]|nr:hypothetical protein [Deltaproteobacteria bacterium]